LRGSTARAGFDFFFEASLGHIVAIYNILENKDSGAGTSDPKPGQFRLIGSRPRSTWDVCVCVWWMQMSSRAAGAGYLRQRGRGPSGATLASWRGSGVWWPTGTTTSVWCTPRSPWPSLSCMPLPSPWASRCDPPWSAPAPSRRALPRPVIPPPNPALPLARWNAKGARCGGRKCPTSTRPMPWRSLPKPPGPVRGACQPS
jgi:hypothetical protein